MRSTSVALVLLTACGSSRVPRGQTRAAPPKIEIPDVPEAETLAPVATETESSPPEIREPESPACRLSETSWSFTSLRLREGGTVFAGVSRAPTTLLLPAGEPKSATAVFDDGKLLLRGLVAPSDLQLFAREAVVLRGFLVPRARTPLVWSGGATGTLTLSIDAKGALSSPERVDDAVPCEKLGLNMSAFNSREVVTKRAALPQQLVTRQGAELAVGPGEAPVATLNAGQSVEVLQLKAGFAKILIEDPKYSAFGWVRAADLGALPPTARHGRLSGSHRTLPPFVRDGLSCARDLSLYAQLRDERVRVGLLRKETLFWADTAEPEPSEDPRAPPARGAYRAVHFVRVTVPATRWLSVASDARLLVPADEYRECGPRARPR